jgi:hypothetical protein
MTHVLAHVLQGRDQSLDVGLIIHRIREKDWLPETVKEEARAQVEQYYQDEF